MVFQPFLATIKSFRIKYLTLFAQEQLHMAIGLQYHPQIGWGMRRSGVSYVIRAGALWFQGARRVNPLAGRSVFPKLNLYREF